MPLRVETALPAVAAVRGIQVLDVWKENNVSGTKPTYQSLLTELSGLLGPVHAKSEGKPDDAITIEPDILASIVTVLGAVEDERQKNARRCSAFALRRSRDTQRVPFFRRALGPIVLREGARRGHCGGRCGIGRIPVVPNIRDRSARDGGQKRPSGERRARPAY